MKSAATLLAICVIAILPACAQFSTNGSSSAPWEESLAALPGERGKTLPSLRVSDDGRFLVNEDGEPFFYLADTAWGIASETTPGEVDLYLENRAAKKFTVIHLVTGRSLYHAFKNLRIGSPIQEHWQRVDYIIKKASALGLYVGLLPVWGDAVISREINSSNAFSYGKFLGMRYRAYPIVWILGGDKGAEGYEDVWRELAKGIAYGTVGREDYGRVLMTYHPAGGQSSSQWFHGDVWLDFNMIQSSHCQNHPNYSAVESDYRLRPVKPTMDAEAVYENISDCLVNGRPKASDYDVRKAAYWSVFAGGHGFTYGANEVYGFWDPGETGFGYESWGADLPWKQALDLPGAFQMQHLRTLMESRPYLNRVPDQAVVVSPHGSGDDRVQATRGSDGSYAFVYISSGNPVSIDLEKINGPDVHAAWYNPRTGSSLSIGRFQNGGIRTFEPPTAGVGSDWILVLDDASRQFALPGRALVS